MRKLLLVVTLALAPSLAWADDPIPPAPAATGTAWGHYPDPIHLEVGAVAAIPKGDLTDVVKTSFGVRVAGNYWFNEYFNAGVMFRYIFVRVSDDAPSGVSVNYIDVGVGGEAQYPILPGVCVFGEAEIMEAHLSGTFLGESDSGSGIGYLFRGGAKLDVTGAVAVIAAVSYSHANVEIEGETGKARWVAFDVGLGFAF